MTEPSIREVLDDNVRAYAADILERPGLMTGWVLCVATTRLDEDGDAAYAYDYSCSPDMDLIRAVGLVTLCNREMLRQVNGEGS